MSELGEVWGQVAPHINAVNGAIAAAVAVGVGMLGKAIHSIGRKAKGFGRTGSASHLHGESGAFGPSINVERKQMHGPGSGVERR